MGLVLPAAPAEVAGGVINVIHGGVPRATLFSWAGNGERGPDTRMLVNTFVAVLETGRVFVGGRER